MRKVRDTKLRFCRPADFSITDHLGESLSVFRGEDRQKVRIRFDEFAARLVSERRWHDSQKLRPLAGGGLEITMELGSLEEIRRWVLSWGAHAEVVEPAALKKQIRAAAQAILAQP
jgi:predicted DNA-binding transcriptional regulator YafY